MAYGMAEEGGPVKAFNYGTAGGCTDTNQKCKNDWTKNQVARVSQGWDDKPIHLLPQIYHYEVPDQPMSWVAVAKNWRNQGNVFRFDGITFQEGSNCPPKFGFPANKTKTYKTAQHAWVALHKQGVAPQLGRDIVEFDCPWPWESLK